MKILLINKFYYLAGGTERYIFAWEKILRAKGHEVMIFSMSHPRNRPCGQAEFFVDEVRFAGDLPLREKLRAATHALWSREARRKMRALLDAEGLPDIAHVRSYLFQLTPSILRPLAERGVPIIQSCPDYAPVCVNQHLYNSRTETICEACLRTCRLAPVWKRCIKGSFAASAVGCLAGWLDRHVGRSRRHIRRFITPSAFMRKKLVAGGLPAERVAYVPHFIDAQPIEHSDKPGDYVLFFGRLVPQKGIYTFLKAAQLCSGIPCKILGGGPLEAEVRARIAEQNLDNVECLGHCEGDALWSAVRHARAIVVPSEWYEPFGHVILEAMAAARPVIASDIAGPAEIVADGEDGILFPPGDAEALANAMETLWKNPGAAVRMGRLGREKALSKYSPETHHERLMRHFQDVLR